MSVSRTAARLIATCVASGALVGAAAVPALADGAGHGRDTRASHSGSYRPEAVGSDRARAQDCDRDRDRDRARAQVQDCDRDRGRDRDRDRDRAGTWDRHHGWYRMWHRRHHHHHFLGRG